MVKLGLISRNVREVISPPRKARQEMQELTASQACHFLVAVSG